jgi:predicted DCC family thiol-disulfide oxidoreductase YuxK
MAAGQPGTGPGLKTMADRSPENLRDCLLLYDGQCRLCVAAKKGIEQLEAESASNNVRMIMYQSEEARQVLGTRYRTGRPDAAFLVRPNGELTSGLDAFLPLLPGLKGGRFLAVLFKLPLVRPLGYLLYWFVARYRYRLFGEVTLEGPSGPEILSPVQSSSGNPPDSSRHTQSP